MPFRPIQWARQNVEGRQIEADGSSLNNFYAVQLPDPTESKTPVMLYGTPGLRRFINVPVKDFVDGTSTTITRNKGIHSLLEVDSSIYGHWLFGLSSQSQLFRLRQGTRDDIEDNYDPFKTQNPDTVYTVPAADIFNYNAEIDVLAPDRPRKLVTDGRRIVWVNKDNAFYYDLKEPNEGVRQLTTPQPSDAETLEDLAGKDWVDCAWIDGYFILASRSGQFFHSLLDSKEFDQLDFARANAKPDDLVGIATLDRRIYLIGTRTVEQWFNAGRADFAFAPDQSASINVGCASRDTIATNETHVIFLGSNGIVYAMNGNRIAGISTETVAFDIDNSIQSYARAYTYTEENHRFYVLTLYFPDGARKTWAYDFVTGLWHERSATDILCAIQYGVGTNPTVRRNLIGREGQSHVFDQNLDWGMRENDVGDEAISRECISPVVFANLQRVKNSTFLVDVPLRPGAVGDEISFDYTKNRGDNSGERAWVQARTRMLNQGPRLRWNRLGQFYYGRNFRLRTSARRRVDIIGAYVETDIAPD